MSDFQRNSIIMLRCFNENLVIDGNIKWVWTVGSNMLINLTFVELSCGTNFKKVIFNVLTFIIIRLFFDFSNCGDHTRNINFQVLIVRIHDLEYVINFSHDIIKYWLRLHGLVQGSGFDRWGESVLDLWDWTYGEV